MEERSGPTPSLVAWRIDRWSKGKVTVTNSPTHHTPHTEQRNVQGAGLDEEAEDGVGAGGLGVQFRGAHVPLLLPLGNQGQGLVWRWLCW